MVWQWAVVPSGLAKVLLFVKAARVLAKKSLQNLIFGAVKTPRSGSPQLR